ncbi:MAG TPA: alpha/beta fold hydrolase [Candidatus Bathyarchaeota archaeon]|nr:alpha/beta fold hydrolase [Candidatus Bathyarchaeota archaeon]
MESSKLKYEENKLRDGSDYVLIYEGSLSKHRSAVLGCRGWANMGIYKPGLHRELDAIGEAFAKEGYVWAATDYGVGGYPIKRALASLNILQMKLKSEGLKSFSVIGFSMGGQIALMYSIKYPDNVSCVVDVYGVSDLPRLVSEVRRKMCLLPLFLPIYRDINILKVARKFLKDVSEEFGVKKLFSPYPEGYFEYSPIHNIDKLNVPVLIVHGTKDLLVPYKHSVTFYEKLKKMGKTVSLVTVKDGGHDQETVKKAIEEILGFTKRYNPP